MLQAPAASVDRQEHGGEHMSAKRRGVWRQSIPGQFSWRLIEMLESPAFRALSLSARKVLDRLEIELHHHGGNDNGKLATTYQHFAEYGMDRHAIGPAIRECVALGFVEITQQGRGGNAEFRVASRYRLTYRHLDKAAPTDEWQRIETLERAETIARMVRQSGRRKTETGGEKFHFSVGKTHTEKAARPVWKTPTIVPVGEIPTTSISRVQRLGPAPAQRRHQGRASGRGGLGVRGNCGTNRTST
jgi:hypothetical protein